MAGEARGLRGASARGGEEDAGAVMKRGDGMVGRIGRNIITNVERGWCNYGVDLVLDFFCFWHGMAAVFCWVGLAVCPSATDETGIGHRASGI